MALTRRGALAGGLWLAATPALAEAALDAAPPATDIAAWTRYEARLRERLRDGGGLKFDDASARAALEATNAHRRAAGAAPLDWHDELAAAARAHAADQAARDYVEHLSPEGFDPSHRFWLLGRTTIGSPSENIAYHRAEGPPASAAELVGRWRRSPGHWRNLLRASHTHAAYGAVRGRDRIWLVGLYTRPVATLAEPLPFRPRGPDVARALRSLPGEHRARVAAPQGSRRGRADGGSGVLQITAIRRVDATAFDVVGGPIFLTAEG